MNAALPGNEHGVAPSPDDVSMEGGSKVAPSETGQQEPVPALTPVQRQILAGLSERHQLSFSVLQSRVGAPAEELRSALDGLRALGLVSRLNTVVESYAARFPGLRVDD